MASASDYGCKVLLCLSNPNGPKAVGECVPPINQLFRDLARGRAFPTCDLTRSDSQTGNSWAQPGQTYYDPCPPGTSALSTGEYAVQGTPPILLGGIGEGDGLVPGQGDNFSPLPSKVCVGSKVGDTRVSTDSENSTLQAGIFDHVVVLNPQASPNVLDVYINSVLTRRVRW